MKHIVAGAGATLAEALALGNAREDCPPLVGDFARKMWSNYTPHPVLEAYLKSLGYEELPHDPRELFYKLECESKTDIEHFMEYVWHNRDTDLSISDQLPPGYIAGLRITSAGASATEVTGDGGGGFWDNLLYHGIGSPLSFMMLQCFHENSSGWKDLKLTKSIAARFSSDDFVLNLNYDTVFELALMQMGDSFVYAPGAKENQLTVCKPHGSLNMVANETSFTFGQPEWLGMPQASGYRSYSGLVPPRLSKSYAQHPMAEMILAPALKRRPQKIVMWGVGLTPSDEALNDVYVGWSKHADVIEVINPSADVAQRARQLFECEVRHFPDVSAWIQ